MSRAFLVLGAAMRGAGRPGPALIRRAEHAAALWQAAPETLVVTSGAGGEAEAAAAICRAAGVPPERLICESAARSTAENIAFCRPILARSGICRVTLVTDGYHAPRALFLARRAGLSADASCPARPPGPPGRRALALLREGAAIAKALALSATGRP
ncbi:YdcF family protein [Rhodovulum sulfidophilum]|uniref:YdcF family protein n=1 Tax=Rhodovulum sulfidophilum TaxID=35806 RepID=UPI001924DAAE|nr:YdcF family protein [Rhodovulum sulfidophilum]MBL3563894.1 YdcF family protein [Rhodovulum sulfidophilum]